ncbi:MAG: hypothetical protein WB586_07250 [Chthoniobacterales bacterium]
MKHLICFAVFAMLGATVSFAGMVPLVLNDPNLIRLGHNQCYYRIASDSKRFWQWGLGRAPIEEPTMFNRGHGNDVVGIPFDADGRVAFAPVYIYTIVPEGYEERRLLKLVQGKSTKNDVRALFGSAMLRRQVNGYEVWYYEIKVFNPFEETPSGQGKK